MVPRFSGPTARNPVGITLLSPFPLREASFFVGHPSGIPRRRLTWERRDGKGYNGRGVGRAARATALTACSRPMAAAISP
jgi:hypothetical protein